MNITEGEMEGEERENWGEKGEREKGGREADRAGSIQVRVIRGWLWTRGRRNVRGDTRKEANESKAR